ncbi:type II toxin-antitoxin system Phd/YefM family antitoxin [Methylomonas rivi]|uniref:Antitoxin n=1 Tax=Methylomonas rivi TaxID=2952226 RepID=A0ABT1U3R7_9GAMM|nr:type II toxin-antitoxin system Phd/YefM family antitoxin [Methylomonas sp. WSC-6]MBS4051310.1 type II toxin-antitoxin system Phd/YefM family antitoxin [Methylomonas sp.]MCQ8128482.1 type II toxin-antitoxin system Phd/YefM family antitoxin [Methylomonas sp. WSC-6]
MNLVTDIKPVSYLKAHSAELLQQINQTHRPIVITQNGEPRGVLQDAESYENMRNALSLLKLLAQSEEDIRNGDLLEQQDVFREMDELLAE